VRLDLSNDLGFKTTLVRNDTPIKLPKIVKPGSSFCRLSLNLSALFLNKRRANRREDTRLEDLIVAFLFLAFCFVFALESWTNFSARDRSISPQDKHLLAPYPNLRFNPTTWSQFSEQLTNFYNDRFPWRAWFVSRANWLKYRLFATSSNKIVIPGKKGWLYLWSADERLLATHALMPPDRVVAWIKLFESRRNWLAKRGSNFLLVISPSKSSIYDENLLPNIVSPTAVSATDQIIASLKKHDSVQVLDLRPTLRANKKFGRLYFRSDSHWSPLGAFVAYREIINGLRSLFPNLRPIERSDLEIETKRYDNGDLAKLLGLHPMFSEPYDAIKIKSPRANRETFFVGSSPSPTDEIEHAMVVSTVNSLQLPSAFILRDSFFTPLMPFIAENFRKARYVPAQSFPADAIEVASPDVVIQEINERFFFDPLPDDCETVKCNSPGTYPVINYRYGPNTRHGGNLLDIYYPQSGTAPYPLVVCIHPGGWGAGDKRLYFPYQKLLRAGFAVSTINYRLLAEGVRFPTPISDCKLAVTQLKVHAKQWQIDPNRIGVWGMSSGGHLAGLLGTTCDSRSPAWAHTAAGSNRIAAMCLWCAPTDLTKYVEANRSYRFLMPAVRALIGAPVEKRPDLARAASPITYVHQNSPACLIVHGDQDRYVDVSQAIAFSKALKATGAPVNLNIIKGATHDLGPEAEQITVDFFKRTLMPRRHSQKEMSAAQPIHP